jgi:hypothetical protein
MTQPNIEALKREHGALYRIDVGSTVFIFRQLTLDEYAVVDGVDATPEMEDYIIDVGVVYPRPVPKLLTGQYTNLAGTILGVSGWSDEEAFMSVLEEKRKLAFTHHPEATALICTYFNMSPDRVHNMKFEEFLSYVAQVEVITGKRVYSTKRDRIKGALSPSVPQIAPQPAGGNKWSPPNILEAMKMSGMEPAAEDLRRRMQEETGKTPVTIEEALKTRKRPDENLSKGGISKTLIGKKDYLENPESWKDGPPI